MVAAVVAAKAFGVTPPGTLPKPSPVKLCADGATIVASDQCPQPLHSGRVDHGLRAELRIVIACSQPPGPIADLAIEKSLFAAGFDTLNRRRLAGEAGRAIRIEAIRNGQLIRVTGFPAAARPGGWSRVAIALYSRPPSAGDRRLSRRLQTLASNIEPRTCHVEDLTRAANPVSSASTFDDVAHLARQNIAEARRRDPGSTAYRIHPSMSAQ